LPSSSGAKTRFIADAMLGSLARKLRALGFDTSYYKSGDDSGIIGLAADEGRVILTSDRSLVSRASTRNVKAILLAGKSDGERVSIMARATSSMGIPLVGGAPLCSLCGGALEPLKKADVSGHVPASVEARHRLFFRCRSCGQYYWRGSHWKKLRSLARRLQAK